ncbi:MAG: tRNA pseudouridine(38-40) synthase TruA [Euryarchaeota archaeon]|nr:tRNA pseudouridine(38-40) synthase TruA [Euryarchaeota archaeon]
MRIALKFAYDGQKFDGYARQPNRKTVEGELLNALITQGFIDGAKTSCFRSASRTDKGVSALGNVIAVNTDTSKERVIQELKEKIPHIFVYGIQNVDSDFYPRYAKLRIYRYYLENKGFVVDDVLSAAAIFTGEHNFKNFARVEEGKNPKRTIDAIVVSDENKFLVFDFYAQNYLWNQIRRLISSIEKVGLKKLTNKHLSDALNDPEKKVDFGLSPAEPLILKDIVYDFGFEYNKNTEQRLCDFERAIISSLSSEKL